MLKDIPYSTLKLEPRNYEILLLYDLYDNTYTDIAKEFGLTPVRVIGIYHKLKIKQIRLYINHLSIVSGHENVTQFRKLYNDVFNCYWNYTYAAAYFEKKYKDILEEYRSGEPGMPQQFIKLMPPFKPELDKKTIEHVITMREVDKKSYIDIGKELQLTRFKAQNVYEMFYHKMVVAFISILQEETDNKSEKAFLWDYYFRSKTTSKKRYDFIVQAHPELLNIDASGQFDPK